MAARQAPRMIPEQIQASKILKMSLPEMQSFVEQQVLENPALVVEESSRCPFCGAPLSDSNCCRICGCSPDHIPAHDSDDDEYYHERDHCVNVPEDDDLDPFGSVAAETDLQSHLHRQAADVLEGHAKLVADYMIDSLDDRGYFTESLIETATLFGLSVPELRQILDVVQTFDPVGIGATNVRECILIQLRHIAEPSQDSRLAQRIAEECWDDLAKMKWQRIAEKLDADVDDVKSAVEFLGTELTPYPASLYRPQWQEFAPTQVAKIVPDVVIRQTEDGLSVEVVDFQLGVVKIDEIYEAVYNQVRQSTATFTDDERKHVVEQVTNARNVLEAIDLRKATLARMALHLAGEQRDFVTKGRQHLRPMTQKQVAEALGVHESTVSRAVSEKYVQLPCGEVVSFDLFFDSALPVKERILQIVSAAGARQPSDSQIAAKLAEQGIQIARRTVAKYRMQLQLPAYHLRAA